MPKFEFLRLSLSIPTIGDLIKEDQRKQPDQTRRDFLTCLFSRRQDFFYRGRQFTYMPFPDDLQGPDAFAAYIGKPVEDFVNEGPEHLFALTKQKHYKASFVAVDVSPTEQLVAFEKRDDVGSARPILEAMFEHYVQQRKGYSWHTDVEYLSSQLDFWKAAKEYQGRITELSFEFLPPNGLKGFEKFKNLDRLAKDQANGQSSTYSIKNKDAAISPKGDFVESAVEYASEGPGRIIMKEGRRILYNSKRSKKTKNAPESLMPRQGEGSKILGLIPFLFGKRDD